jgi:hypothetical protein
MDQKEITNRAKAFIADLTDPLGPRPLEKVVRAHIDLFIDLREAGVSWRQLSDLMAKHGVRKKDGSLMSHKQWMAVVSRARGLVKPSLLHVIRDKNPQNKHQRNERNKYFCGNDALHDLSITRKGYDKASIIKVMQNARLARDEE